MSLLLAVVDHRNAFSANGLSPKKKARAIGGPRARLNAMKRALFIYSFAVWTLIPYPYGDLLILIGCCGHWTMQRLYQVRRGHHDSGILEIVR